MKLHNKIAIIGGTGKSGQYLVKEALNQGYTIKVLVRNPEHFTIQHPLLEVIQGNVTDYATVLRLTAGCDAIISTLGLGIPNSIFTVFSEGTINILRAMESRSIQRYIVITGLNVDTPMDNKGPKTQWGTNYMKENFPKTSSDKQLEYQLLKDSTVNWTLVRLPLIVQTDERNPITHNLQDCPGDTISATSLAIFLLQQLQDTTFIRQAPFIANT
ncbi:NAD(P)-dependent oxidoreductase [Flavobacterium kingsejongi]|uniref:Epimerase n=1 Tax=Flavobacterium kingsejongi TaxID=1678728 RepID=A0A2S1LTH9_9FLAO|nr:SDR family oxidoreductase [Flavobacterium kingsejongi]AWG26946.1 epimerase [Flavobacterium kingsejongi]